MRWDVGAREADEQDDPHDDDRGGGIMRVVVALPIKVH